MSSLSAFRSNKIPPSLRPWEKESLIKDILERGEDLRVGRLWGIGIVWISDYIWCFRLEKEKVLLSFYFFHLVFRSIHRFEDDGVDSTEALTANFIGGKEIENFNVVEERKCWEIGTGGGNKKGNTCLHVWCLWLGTRKLNAEKSCLSAVSSLGLYIFETMALL